MEGQNSNTSAPVKTPDFVIKIEAIDKKEFPGHLGVFEANRLISEMETALFPNN